MAIPVLGNHKTNIFPCLRYGKQKRQKLCWLWPAAQVVLLQFFILVDSADFPVHYRKTFLFLPSHDCNLSLRSWKHADAYFELAEVAQNSWLELLAKPQVLGLGWAPWGLFSLVRSENWPMTCSTFPRNFISVSRWVRFNRNLWTPHS